MAKFLIIVAAVLCLSLLKGAEANSRILDGDSDDNNDLRYTVAIQKIIPEHEGYQHICGGAIIDKRFVLTAAHCVYGLRAKQLIVRAGFKNEQTGIDTTTYYKVLKYMHPKTYFNSTCRSHENDIALLKISRTFDLLDEEKFKKVQLPEYDLDYEDASVVFTGFGAEKYEIIINKTTNATKGSFIYPEKARYFESTVVPLEKCRSILPVTVTEGNICTNNDDATGFSCRGDSGGPLVYNGIVIGVRNKHEECSDYVPELYTRVTAYLKFIHDVLNYKFSYNINYVH